jgi:hypothetical protein
MSFRSRFTDGITDSLTIAKTAQLWRALPTVETRRKSAFSVASYQAHGDSSRDQATNRTCRVPENPRSGPQRSWYLKVCIEKYQTAESELASSERLVCG